MASILHQFFVFFFDSSSDAVGSGLPADLAAVASSGKFQGTIWAILPRVSSGLDSRDVVFHSSLVEQFPDDYRVLSARKPVDRCVILDFADGDERAPLLVVCLLNLSFLIVAGVSDQ